MNVDIVFAAVDFAISAMQVYAGLTGTGNTAFNFAAALFCFGTGIVQTAIYLKNGR